MILWYKDFLQFSRAENVSILSEAHGNFNKLENSRSRYLEAEIDPLFFFPSNIDSPSDPQPYPERNDCVLEKSSIAIINS